MPMPFIINYNTGGFRTDGTDIYFGKERLDSVKIKVSGTETYRQIWSHSTDTPAGTDN